MGAYTVNKPSFTDRAWIEEVTRVDKDNYKRDIVYEWSNERKMQSTDSTDQGVYDGN